MSIKSDIEKRVKAVKDEFELNGKEIEKLVEEGKKINQRHSQLRVRQDQLRGSYAELNALLGNEEEPKKTKG